MRALFYTRIGGDPELVEVPTPEPGPGEVRVKITAAGACHSDSHLMDLTAGQFTAQGLRLPLSLGHEGTGVVDKLGRGVAGVELGTPVAIYGPQGCGRCYACSQGKENYCARAQALGIASPGLGAPGTMAEYVVLRDARHLVELGELDPVDNVALTDAGLTPYHAIKASLPKLVPGTTALVIGVGGLGHLAVQILRALTPSTVIAIDTAPEKLSLARAAGAHHAFASDEEAAGKIRRIARDRGVTAVFDFVVVPPTVELGSAVLGLESDLVLVGAGATRTPVGMLAKPYDSTIRAPYWGSRAELIEVLDLARAGLVRVETEVFSLDEAPAAYKRLREGTLLGRAVVVP